MRKFLVLLVSFAVLAIFSSAVLAKGQTTTPQKSRIVERPKVQVSPKGTTFLKQKNLAKGSAAGKVAPKKRLQVRVIYKKIVPWYANPLVQVIGGGLLIALTAIITRFIQFGRIPRREEEAEVEEDLPGWGQRIWARIKRRCPAPETS